MSEEVHALEASLRHSVDLIRQLTKKESEARGDLTKIERHLADLKGRIHRMRYEYPVVLLSEYGQAKKLLGLNSELLITATRDLKRAVRELTHAQELQKAQELRLQQIRSQLSTEAVVIPFRQ